MGRITFKEIGSIKRKHENTKNEYDNEVSYELLCHRLRQVTGVVKNSENKVCYILGMGAHPKSTYTELRNTTGLELVWFGSILPRPLRVFSWIVASFAGLIKVINPDKLSGTFLKLTKLSMAGIYLFDSSYESTFVNAVLTNPIQNEYDFTIKDDGGYFYYIVDADNEESSTGIYEIVSYGKEAKRVAELF